uniref:Uncharacterized protein n=1 Tax=Riboviria sp. TaxID=2585031 RepID=A0A893A7D0_9VIRU|nr:MAG: hypothetical protein [Riboviria sp.]
MRGYRCEEWNMTQIKKAFALPARADFYFRISRMEPRHRETFVSSTLPVFLGSASLPRPDHKDKLNILAGSFKRLAAEVPSISFSKSKKIIRYMRKYILPQFRTFQEQDVPGTEDWINNINHPESRKQQLREAYADLQKGGLFPGDEDPRVCKSFVKDEPYEEEKPLRWINASSDLIKVAFGPIADACMHRLVESESMIKTVPVAERAKAICSVLGGPYQIAQSSDATAMEDHYANIPNPNNDPRYRIQNEAMIYLCGGKLVPLPLLRAVQFAFYETPGVPKGILVEQFESIRESANLRSFFRNIIDTYRKLKMREFGYVLVNAILCSGEMNTSFKNTFTMYVMVNYASFDLSRGIHPLARTVNEGDDSLAVYASKPPTELWWREHGWVVKVEFRGPVHRASFCGLIFDPLELKVVPDIRKNLAKLGWVGRKYVRSPPKIMMGLLRSKALSMACEFKDVPILGPLSMRLLELTRHVHVRQSIIDSMDMYTRERFMTYLNEKPWMTPPNVGDGTRALVADMQNISVSVQIQMERHLSIIPFGEFSTPGLEYPAAWVHNMTRTFTKTDVPKVLDLKGRARVTAALRGVVMNSGQRPSRIKSMLRDLRLLERGCI